MPVAMGAWRRDRGQEGDAPDLKLQLPEAASLTVSLTSTSTLTSTHPAIGPSSVSGLIGTTFLVKQDTIRPQHLLPRLLSCMVSFLSAALWVSALFFQFPCTHVW